MSIKSSLKSSWTPLTHDAKNNQIYEERKKLVFKWFDKWTEEQRKTFLKELFQICKPSQLQFASKVLEQKAPVYHKDFTAVLPKVISQYIFSYLDPRSLCRAMQVSSHWKFLAESNQIWLPKCIRLGWFPNPQQYMSEYEYDSWKRLYVENIRALQVARPNKEILVAAEAEAELRRQAAIEKKKEVAAERRKRPPAWRGPDPRPKDTNRNNYLDNDNEVENARKLRHKGYERPLTTHVLGVKKAVKNNKTVLAFSPLRRSNSTGRLTGKERTISARTPTDEQAPIQDWFDARTATAAATPAGANHGKNFQTYDGGAKRPPPVTKLVRKHRSPERTNRDMPSIDLFPQNPWTGSMDNAFDSD